MNRNHNEVANQVTVLIKTFRRPRSCYKLLRSIRLTYPNIQILLADDSGDKYFDEYEYHVDNVSLYKMPEGAGLVAGRNLLISECKTKYFFLCDDDFVFSKKTDLYTAIEEIEEKNLDILQSRLIDLDANGNILKERSHCGLLNIHGGWIKNDCRIEDDIELYDFVMWTFLAKTETFHSKNLYGNEKFGTGDHQRGVWLSWSYENIRISKSNNFSVYHANDRPKDYRKIRMNHPYKEIYVAMLKEIEAKPYVIVMSHPLSRAYTDIIPVLEILGWNKFPLTEEFQKINSFFLRKMLTKEELAEKGKKILDENLHNNRQSYIACPAFINTLDHWKEYFKRRHCILLYLEEDDEYMKSKIDPKKLLNVKNTIEAKYSCWPNSKMKLRISDLINLMGEGANSIISEKLAESTLP